MKKIVKLILFAGLISSTQARAEDDILSILDGKGKETLEKPTLARSEFRGLVGATSAEQNIFFGFLEKQDWERALYQWNSAFPLKSGFANSENGQALHAWLMVKNGLQATGLEKLLSIKNPEKVAKTLEMEWKNLISVDDPVWTMISPSLWKSEWVAWFGNKIEVKIRGREILSQGSLDTIKSLISKSQANTTEYSWLVWQLSVLLSQKDPGTAAQTLAHLMKAQSNPVGQDLLDLTAARILYQNGYLDAAIKYYQKVPKASEYWLESQEEIAWSFLRKGEPQNALAISKTFVNSSFVIPSGPEALFLRSLAQLKVCDYSGVVESLNQFRQVFRDRTVALMKTASNDSQSNAENQAQFRELAREMSAKSLRQIDFGPRLKTLPRQVVHDHILQEMARYETKLKQESELAGQIYARSAENGTATVGFQAEFELFKNSILQSHHQSEAAFDNRLRALAQEEVTEIKKFLQKMHIVEAELLSQSSMSQRILSANEGRTDLKKGSTGSQGRDRLTFAVDQELWFDELSNYRIDVKGACRGSKQ